MIELLLLRHNFPVCCLNISVKVAVCRKFKRKENNDFCSEINNSKIFCFAAHLSLILCVLVDLATRACFHYTLSIIQAQDEM
jgi:hypothetical protein